MVHPSLDLWTGRAFPELAAALRAVCGPVLERWEAAVRRVLPGADELTFAQLRNNFPGAVDEMAAALAAERPAPTTALPGSSVEHGEARFHQQYNINEVLIEYTLLRRVVVEEVASHLGRGLSTDEVLALDLSIDTSARAAVVTFAEHQSALLKNANEAQSKYLSFLSHDLRGGLNGIFLMIEVLKRELGAHPQYKETIEDLDAMRRQLLETVATMDRFLYAERFRKGKVKLKPGPVRLDTLLNEVAAQFTYQARDKGLELKVNAPSPASVVSDRELLTLIVQNLISNAVKYSDRQTAVRVGARPAEGAGGGWHIDVADQGPGIAQEKLSGLFESFTRGDTHGKPGVGLGLSIAYQAAQMLGAKLWADANPGKGSTFHVRLPEAVKEHAARPADS